MDRAEMDSGKRKGVAALLAVGACLTASLVGVVATRDSQATNQPKPDSFATRAAPKLENGDATGPSPARTRADPLIDASGSPEDSIQIGPVASGHDSILKRAQQGDLNAACAHAVELNECALRNQTLASAEQIQAAMATGGTSTDDKAVGTVAALLNSADRKAAECAGVTTRMLNDAFEMQRIASQRSREHARWLATNPALDQNTFLSDVERWANYKKIAKAYFDDAMRSQRLEDLPALLLVYYPGDVALPRPPYRQPDEAKFLALYELARTQGMQLPKDLTSAAELLKKRESVPRLSPMTGWGGAMPKSVEQGISKAMFPSLTKDFCG